MTKPAYCILTLLLLVGGTAEVGCEQGRDYRLPEAPPHDWSFVIIGDSGSGSAVFERLVSMITELPERPRFAVSLGDVVGHAENEVEWSAFDHAAAPLRAFVEPGRLFVTPGNHDISAEAASRRLFQEYTANPGNGVYYAVRESEVAAFVVATSLPESPSSFTEEQALWLEGELAGESAPYRFMFAHVPPFPIERYTHTFLGGRDRLHQIALAGNVQAVFSGHQHFFDHRNEDGIKYFISGGGGSMQFSNKGGSHFHFIVMYVSASAACAQVINIDYTLEGEFCFAPNQ